MPRRPNPEQIANPPAPERPNPVTQPDDYWEDAILRAFEKFQPKFQKKDDDGKED